MRKTLFWSGWAVLIVLPLIYAFEIWRIQDLPPVALWQWGVPIAAAALIYFTRNRDDVLRHHLV